MKDNPSKKFSLNSREQRLVRLTIGFIFALTLVLAIPYQQPVLAQATTPVISLSASCTPDAQGTFTITNIGTSMTGPGTYTLLLNGTPIATNSFQLNAGASTQIHTSGLFGTLELDTSGGGAAPATVSTFCQTPTATPTLVPPTLSLSANCTVDAQGTFTITNIGSNMTGPGTWTLSLNGTPIATDSFQLNAGASTQIHTSGLFGTLELDASGGGTVGTATVSTFCQSPTATPTLVPSTLSLSASCTPDAQGTFTITNIGASMTSPGTWTLSLNGTPIATNSFQLNAGASINVNTSGLFGTLRMDTSGGGAAPATVSTFCQSPTATPTLVPPTLSLSANCTPDAQGTFTITNIGSNMTGPGTWTLSLNGTPIATNNFQLNAGASTSISTSGLFGTLKLDTLGGGTAPATVSTFCQSPTPTGTLTVTATPTPTPTSTDTATVTNTATNTPTVTDTPTPTNTPTVTDTATVTNTATNTPTVTDTPTSTNTPTVTDTATVTPTASATPTSTLTPTTSATSTLTPTASKTSKVKPTYTATFTRHASPTPRPTATKKPDHTPEATRTHSHTPEPTRVHHTPMPTPTRKYDHTPEPTRIYEHTPEPTRPGKYGPTPTPPHHSSGSASVQVSFTGSAVSLQSVVNQAIQFLSQAWQTIFQP